MNQQWPQNRGPLLQSTFDARPPLYHGPNNHGSYPQHNPHSNYGNNAPYGQQQPILPYNQQANPQRYNPGFISPTHPSPQYGNMQMSPNYYYPPQQYGAYSHQQFQPSMQHQHFPPVQQYQQPMHPMVQQPQHFQTMQQRYTQPVHQHHVQLVPTQQHVQPLQPSMQPQPIHLSMPQPIQPSIQQQQPTQPIILQQQQLPAKLTPLQISLEQRAPPRQQEHNPVLHNAPCLPQASQQPQQLPVHSEVASSQQQQQSQRLLVQSEVVPSQPQQQSQQLHVHSEVASSQQPVQQIESPPQPEARQYENTTSERKSTIVFPKFDMQFKYFQKRGDIAGEEAKETINRSHLLITNDEVNRTFVTFCKWNPLHVLDCEQIRNHELTCIDRDIINQLNNL